MDAARRPQPPAGAPLLPDSVDYGDCERASLDVVGPVVLPYGDGGEVLEPVTSPLPG